MANGEEFRFTIDAYTPETIPMERLAQYLGELAILFGESKAVHFVRLEYGSTVPVIKIEREAVPKVRERVRRVERGDAPVEAMRAYQRINQKLKDDNAVGYVQEPAGAQIIQFPGRDDTQDGVFHAVRQQGSIDGEIIRIGGKGSVHVPLAIQYESQTFSHCYAKRPVAKQIGKHLFEPIRLFGTGRWSRAHSGAWTLDNFAVDRFEVLDDQPLSSALTLLRAIPGGDWGSDSYREVQDLRLESAD